MSNIATVTQEPILYVDATPDDDYPLRILRAHRENCNVKWVVISPSILYEAINEMCDQRAQILDRAITLLEKAMFFDQSNTTHIYEKL